MAIYTLDFQDKIFNEENICLMTKPLYSQYSWQGANCGAKLAMNHFMKWVHRFANIRSREMDYHVECSHDDDTSTSMWQQKKIQNPPQTDSCIEIILRSCFPQGETETRKLNTNNLRQLGWKCTVNFHSMLFVKIISLKATEGTYMYKA